MTREKAYITMWCVVKRYCYECPEECDECPIGELREWLNEKERGAEK